MSFFEKVFKYQSSENHEDFVSSLGLPEEKAGFFMEFKPDQKIEKSGDAYVYSFNTPRGFKDVTFTSGVEFEDKNLSVKNTFTVEGNKVTHVMKFDSGLTINSTKDFSATKLIEKLTNNKWDGVDNYLYCLIHYKFNLNKEHTQYN